MRVPVGIICSVLGATIAFYLAVVALVTLPAEGTPRWFAFAGIAALSLLAGILVNGVSMQDFRRVSRDHQETSNLYNTLTSRLSPLLYSGIEDVLNRRKATFKSGGELNYNVMVLGNGLLRTVSSTLPPGHAIRQREAKVGEGLPGFIAEKKIAGFAVTSQHNDGAKRRVLDQFGRQIGEIPVTQAPASAARWHYVKPIFERSTDTPWSSRVVGTLLVMSFADDADSFFKTPEFQHMVDFVANQVSPYLDAIKVLMGEAKQ
jgi:hypothetical protein